MTMGNILYSHTNKKMNTVHTATIDRRHKALVPINKLKEAEFLYMLQGKFYGGAELLKKSQKYSKIAD